MPLSKPFFAILLAPVKNLVGVDCMPPRHACYRCTVSVRRVPCRQSECKWARCASWALRVVSTRG
jgi:hypothetical protein